MHTYHLVIIALLHYTGAFADVYGRQMSNERFLQLISKTRIQVGDDGSFYTHSIFYGQTIEDIKKTMNSI